MYFSLTKVKWKIKHLREGFNNYSPWIEGGLDFGPLLTPRVSFHGGGEEWVGDNVLKRSSPPPLCGKVPPLPKFVSAARALHFLQIHFLFLLYDLFFFGTTSEMPIGA